MSISRKLLYFVPFMMAIIFTACTDYGKKVKHGHIEVYYKDGITEDMAQKTADFVYQIDIADSPGLMIGRVVPHRG